jgi:hypothetical protein
MKKLMRKSVAVYEQDIFPQKNSSVFKLFENTPEL